MKNSIEIKKSISKMFRGVDRFSSVITFTLRNSGNYQTVVGGIFSIVQYTLVLLVAVYLFIKMFQRTEVSATQTFIYKNRFNSTDLEDISSGSLSFSFMATNYDYLGPIDKSVGSFHLYQATREKLLAITDSNLVQLNLTEVELENCHPGSKVYKDKWIEGNQVNM
jgi:hypothetical protein